jgi:2-dehydropantoate 2-reductase
LSTQSRLPHASEDDNPELRATYQHILQTRGLVSDVLKSFSHAPEGMKRFTSLGEYVRYGSDLPGRTRELCILSVAAGVEYAWVHHVPHAHKTGLTDAQLATLKAGGIPEGASAAEGAAISFVRAFTNLGQVPDAVYAAVEKHYTPRQITDLMLLGGYFVALGSVVNTLQIPIEPTYEKYVTAPPARKLPDRPRIVFVGAGAVGGYVGGHMARAGHDVTLIDPWPENVEAIRKHGLQLGGTQGEHTVNVKALHVSDAQSLARQPVDLAFICMKLYDTEWATALIKPYLAAGGCVVTMQNSLVEEKVAALVGRERTLGCIASTISVEATGPGRVVRSQLPGGDAYTVFRLGELDGQVTPRAEQIAAMLRACDSAKVTTNLWGERWAKLVANTMTTGPCALSGLNLKDIFENATARKLLIRLAGEAIRVGEALGYRLEPVRGLPAAHWVAAAAGDAAELKRVEDHMLEGARRRPEGGWSGTAQDIAKGRWPEIDFMNGYVAQKGIEAGVPAPTHAQVTERVKQLARGELKAGVAQIEGL